MNDTPIPASLDDWWREHYDMAHLARGAAEDAWNAATMRCAEIADVFADEKDVMAMECVNDNQVSSYREGERTANQIAEVIRKRIILK